VDIHPSGYGRHSRAVGVSGDQIVGEASSLDGANHAILWTSRGVVDLQPTGFHFSQGHATDGVQQVGIGSVGQEEVHALLWSGTAESVVDLHPAGYSYSWAAGVSRGQQVGHGKVGTVTHALLWTGSAQSVVDLHPGGFCETSAFAVAAGWQVGGGTTADGSRHALLWNGTADSVVDLHAFLPAGFRSSGARGIDASGNVVGNAIDANGFARPILWVRQ
jgi:hypothetical protein